MGIRFCPDLADVWVYTGSRYIKDVWFLTLLYPDVVEIPDVDDLQEKLLHSLISSLIGSESESTYRHIRDI